MSSAHNPLQKAKDRMERVLHPETRYAKWFAQNNFAPAQRIRFYEKLSTCEANGAGLKDTVADLKERAATKGKTSALYIILHHVERDLSEGLSFYQSLTPFIPITETMVIRAGENAGSLNRGLLICVDIIQASLKMRSTVLSAISYPIVLFLAICLALYVVGRFAMPKILMKVDAASLTGASQVLYQMSLFMQTNWIYVFMAMGLLFIILVVVSLPRWTGRFRILLDKIPPYSLYRLVIGSGWLLSLGALVDAGVGVLQALEDINETVASKNKWLSQRLQPCVFAIKKGLGLGEALELSGYQFPDQDIIDDVAFYERYPGFQANLIKMGSQEIEASIKRVEKQAAILKWGLFVFFVGVVFTILVGVIGIISQMAGVSFF